MRHLEIDFYEALQMSKIFLYIILSKNNQIISMGLVNETPASTHVHFTKNKQHLNILTYIKTKNLKSSLFWNKFITKNTLTLNKELQIFTGEPKRNLNNGTKQNNRQKLPHHRTFIKYNDIALKNRTFHRNPAHQDIFNNNHWKNEVLTSLLFSIIENWDDRSKEKLYGSRKSCIDIRDVTLARRARPVPRLNSLLR